MHYHLLPDNPVKAIGHVLDQVAKGSYHFPGKAKLKLCVFIDGVDRYSILDELRLVVKT